MNWATAAGTLRDHFRQQWEALVPSVPITYRNGPKLDPPPDTDKDIWVQIGVINTFSNKVSLGSRYSRRNARVIVNIYTPLFQGDGRSRTYGDVVQAIWDAATLPGISIGDPEFVPGGPDPDLQFWVDSVSTRVTFHHSP